MRYRLMASYLGASYQAAVGPSDRDVTLFAAPPPPEEHGFSPVPGGGIWRKQVRLDDLDGLWESRPIGSYHGEPCLVLDDLGDRLHVVYLGMDERRAGQLGYWQVDRGVFEVVVQRHEVTDLAEERHEFPIALLLSALPRALNAGDAGAGGAAGAMSGSGSGARAGAGPGNSANGIGRIALPSGGQGATAAGAGASTWNGQSAIGTRQLPAAQAQQPPSGRPQSNNGQQLQPVGQTPMQPQPAQQQPMQQPVGMVGHQQMTGAYQQAPGMAQPGAQQTQAAAPQVADAMSGLSSGAAQGPASSPQFLGGIQSPPSAQQGPAMQQGPTGQQGFAVQPGSAQQQFAASATPAAQQTPVTQQAAVAQQSAAAQQQGGAQQFPNAQPPAAVAAWHGSPVPDGNGTWYYQPNVGGQNGLSQNELMQISPAPNGPAANGLTANGTTPNGTTPAGYAPSEQQSTPLSSVSSAVPAGPVTGSPQFGQQTQAEPGAGYQQATGAGYQQAAPGYQSAPGTGYQQAPGTGYQQAAPTGYQQAAPLQQAPSPQDAASLQQAPPPPQAPPLQQAPPAQQPQALTQPQSFTQAPSPQQGPANPQPPSPQQAQSFAQPPPPPSAALAQQQFPAPAQLLQPTQFSQPAAPPGPAPQADAGTTAVNTGPANLGLPLSGQASPSAVSLTSPLAAPPLLTPAPQQTTGPFPTAPAPPQAPAPVQAPAPSQPASTQAASPQRAAPAASAFGRLTGAASAVRGRRAARKPRLAMSAIFADLVDMADIPRAAYAVDEEVTGAMCLFKTEGGYEVFSCAEDARHEVRFFEDEEAAYFYLFGVLAAEALRNGRLSPRRG